MSFSLEGVAGAVVGACVGSCVHCARSPLFVVLSHVDAQPVATMLCNSLHDGALPRGELVRDSGMPVSVTASVSTRALAPWCGWRFMPVAQLTKRLFLRRKVVEKCDAHIELYR